MKRLIKFAVAAVVAVLVFAVAGCAQHVHVYTDGVCSGCGEPCAHSGYTDGICDECGKKCPHAEFDLGVCVECGKQCDHKYTDGVCDVCGTVCEHSVYENELCAECGEPCPHASYEQGVCVECGRACAHTYVGGVCRVCKIACLHERYEKRICVECGETKPAHYDYAPHTAASLPRISITTVSAGDGPKLMNTDSLGFDMNNTNSKNNRPYYKCTVSATNCAGFEFDGAAADVKVRGNYTANYPKKPFRIKFSKKQGMLGLNDGAKLKNWVLLADYKDIAMTRNTLAFYLGNMIFGSDDFYCTDYRPVELYLNDNYWGMYLLAEHQQVNADRVDVTEPEDGYEGTDIGYMLEYDGYYNFETAAQRFTCDYNGKAPLKVRDGWSVYPNQPGFTIKNDVYYSDINNCAQTKFISNYINKLYKLCYEAVYNKKYYAFDAANTNLVPYTPKTKDPVKETVERVVDIRSLVDAYIINELACDADIAWSSFVMRADFGADGDNRLRFEAPWDFDSAFGLKDSCASGEGLFAANSNNPWLVVFINEPWFWNEIKAKWRELQAAGAMNKALDVIKSGRAAYADDYKKNFDKWGFVKSGELNGQAMALKDHKEAVEHLYNWFDTRVKYLDGLWR